MTAEEAKPGGLRGKMRALREKCRSTSVEIPFDELAVVALAKRCLYLEHQETKRQ